MESPGPYPSSNSPQTIAFEFSNPTLLINKNKSPPEGMGIYFSGGAGGI